MRPEVTFTPLAASRPLTRRRILALGMATAGIGMALAANPLRAQDAPSSVMSAQEAYDKAQSGEIILVDIRRPDEWLETGIGEGAIALDMREESFVTSLVSLRRANPDKPIALICRTGNRTKFVVSALSGQGFPGLVDVSEGMVGGPNGKGWKPSGLPVYAGSAENIAARLAEVMP